MKCDYCTDPVGTCRYYISKKTHKLVCMCDGCRDELWVVMVLTGGVVK